MNEFEHHIRLTKSHHEIIVECVASIVAAACLYYATHPEIADDIINWFREVKQEASHRLSVWEAIHSIRSLPESDN